MAVKRAVGQNVDHGTAPLQAEFHNSRIREIVNGIAVGEANSLVIDRKIVQMVMPAEHALRLLAHGMAHLCGLDHSEQMDMVSQIFMDAAIEAVA